MATSLWPLALAFAFGDLLVPWPLEICLCRGQGPGHGAGRGHARRTGNGLKPKAMAIASGHGSRPWPWLGPQAYGQRNVSMGIGYRLWGVGYWVVDIGHRVLGIFTNTFDARWVGGFWGMGLVYLDILDIRVFWFSVAEGVWDREGMG